MKHRLIIDNLHYVLVSDTGKRLLIDTGSPVSCAMKDCGAIVFGEKISETNAFSKIIESVNNSGLVAEPIDALIGMDILYGHRLVFDKNSHSIFIDEEVEEGVYEHTMDLECIDLMGRCICGKMTVNSEEVNAILDTGAWIPYLSAQYLANVEACGDVQDYNPLLGTINTTKHNVTLCIGDISTNVTVGKMPSLLEATLSIIGIDLVIGFDVLPSQKFCLDLTSNRLLF